MRGKNIETEIPHKRAEPSRPAVGVSRTVAALSHMAAGVSRLVVALSREAAGASRTAVGVLHTAVEGFHIPVEESRNLAVNVCSLRDILHRHVHKLNALPEHLCILA
ncbi:MAG TPA: hypothetical protein VK041_10845 [Opitutales bacterium]|nr:hypothetical protein [Opitutales bacterium]